MGVKDSFSL